MGLHLAYDSVQKIKCHFYTLIVRNEALEQKYKGGLIRFLDRHKYTSNESISYGYHMGGDYDKIIDDLVDNGLKGKDDFWMVEAPVCLFSMAASGQQCEIDVGVDWLKVNILGVMFMCRMQILTEKVHAGKGNRCQNLVSTCRKFSQSPATGQSL